MSEFPQCLLIVTAEVDPGVEAEWNRWYDTVHLPDATRSSARGSRSSRLRRRGCSGPSRSGAGRPRPSTPPRWSIAALTALAPK
jgi:hypothetical protein